MKSEIASAADRLFSFLRVKNDINYSDIILILGGHDLSIVPRAVELYCEGISKKIVVSGGCMNVPRIKSTTKKLTEAEAIAQELVKLGVPDNAILLEKRAKNTSENYLLTKNMLDAGGIEFKSCLIVTKPYAELRALLTGKEVLPGVQSLRTACVFG